MKMKIYDTVEKDSKSNLTFYFYSVLIGITIFLILLVSFKTAVFLIKSVIIIFKNYWMFIIGGVVAILFIKKILFKKRMGTHVMQQ